MKEMGRMIGAGLSTIGLGGTAVGTGLVFGSALLGNARNPAGIETSFSLGMIYFALVEAIALFSLIIAILILYG